MEFASNAKALMTPRELTSLIRGRKQCLAQMRERLIVSIRPSSAAKLLRQHRGANSRRPMRVSDRAGFNSPLR